MPAKHHIDHDTQLIITTWEGEADDLEFIAAIKNYQNTIQNTPSNISYNEVVDLCSVTNIKLSKKGLITIGKIATTTDSALKNRKLALIVSSNLAFGLARMYTAYRSLSKTSNKEIQIFKSRDKALIWAQEKD